MDETHPMGSPAQEWSYRVPSPPRIYVPAPLIQTTSGSPTVPFNQYLNHNYTSTGFSNTDFLKTVTYDDFIPTHAMVYWAYESRRQAQQILPFLFLGPISAARDAQFLKTEGISMLLAVRDTRIVNAKILGSKAALELGIPCSTLDTCSNQELIGRFARGIEMINTHLSERYLQCRNDESSSSSTAAKAGKVLVFCETGNERSAAMVAAYLMAMYSMDFIKAIQIIHAQRFSVAFDDGMRRLLNTFDCMLKAKRDVVSEGMRGGSGDGGGGGNENGGEHGASGSLEILNGREVARKKSKRTLDETYEGDMDMDMSDMADEARFERRGAAPFLDDGRA
ncbi:MAG: hypothetical protein Q9221_006982 [Calogaya cf. arnoldii]